jgi:hypothetical protein
MGKILKIANAREIIDANAKYHRIPLFAKIISPIFTAPTGPDILLKDSPALSLSRLRRFENNHPSAVRVRLVSAFISSKATPKDWSKLN